MPFLLCKINMVNYYNNIMNFKTNKHVANMNIQKPASFRIVPAQNPLENIATERAICHPAAGV